MGSEGSRHAFIALTLTLGLAFATGPAGCTDRAVPVRDPVSAIDDDALLEDLEKRTFGYFWETANPDNGLVPDRAPTPSFSSIAAVGFALTAYPIGVERGYVSRAQARARVLTTLRFFRDAPQGEAAQGTTGYRGFYYHFLDMKTGTRFKDVELSTIDTALLLAGALFCSSYFNDNDPEEVELRTIVDQLLARVEWTWIQPRPPAVAMGWTPEQGFLDYDWIGYNEAMILYLLALASPTFAVEPAVWERWTSRYDLTWGTFWGQEHLSFAPLFGHQYSHVWVDFRGLSDDYMQRRGIDYFENSRRATYAQREYARVNPLGWKDYSEDVWGLTASDGPGDVELSYRGSKRMFRGYFARGMATGDDGTLAPTAMISSLPFAPEIVLPGLRTLRQRYGKHLYGTYGFLDAFNPSFTFSGQARTGRVIADFGWINADYLGIDQGPILAMVENHRSELIWRVMRGNPYLRRGLERAGFRGGWLEASR
jgi:hypothetical protein